ncbi:uncharacterized protein LOC143912116 isoform X2 [Arctopsyche grandis]
MVHCVRNKSPYGFPSNDLAESLYHYAAFYLYADAIESIGCPEIETSLPHWECQDNGFVYDSDVLWKSNPKLPANLKDVVRQLHFSTKHGDKYLAALATFSILSTTDLTEKMDRLQYLELINFLNGPKVSKRCCFTMRNRVAQLINIYLKGVLEKVKEIKQKYNNPKACD